MSSALTVLAGPDAAAAPAVLPANRAGGPRLGGPGCSSCSPSLAAAAAAGFFAGAAFLEGGPRGFAGATSARTLASVAASSSIPAPAAAAGLLAAEALGAALAAAAAFFFAAAAAAAAFFSDLSYLLILTVSFAALIFVFLASIRGSTYFYAVAGTRASSTPSTIKP